MLPLMLSAALVLLQGRAATHHVTPSAPEAAHHAQPAHLAPVSPRTGKSAPVDEYVGGCGNLKGVSSIPHIGFPLYYPGAARDWTTSASVHSVASVERQVEWSRPSERLKDIFEAAQEAWHESSTHRDVQRRKVSPSRARQSLGTSNESQHESLDCRDSHFLPGARKRRSTLPQRTHKARGHHNHHHHTHSHQEQRARQGSGRRLRKRHQSHQQQQQQRPSRLKFSQLEYRVTLKEDVPIHTSLLTVVADGAEGTVRYQLNDDTNFGINSAGVIYSIRHLDHKGSGGRYLLQVTAEEKDQGDVSGWTRPVTAQVTLQVTDAPEPPRFDSPHYKFTVSEFASQGSYVGTVRASDDDGDFDHYFLHGTEMSEAFAIDGNRGVITLEETPDGSRWQYHLQAGAADRRGHVTLVPVSVFLLTRLVSGVQGNNGRHPAFPDCESYEDTHVMENVTAGSPVLTVIATDEDSGPSGVISYSLIHSLSSFAIQASDQRGHITTTRRLDRDNGDEEFMLTVVAKDGGVPPLQASCTFRVIVDDLNDNAPVFDQPRYEQTLATDYNLALPVLRVAASDKDIGKNAHLTYHLEGHPNHLEFFYLEPITGVLTLKRHLHDAMANTKTFDVRVRAVDGGTPPLWSTAPITVRIVSSGELPPSVAAQQPLQPAILENTTENTDVVVVCAKSNLPNAPTVYFTLLNGDTPETNSDGTFALREVLDHEESLCGDNSGVSVYVATRTLDFETLQAYKLTVLMVNERNGRLEHQVVVNIVDVNDNAPLLQTWDGSVLENAASTLITTIRAVDKDASPQYRQLRYSFDATAPHDVVSKFALKSNGELWSTRPLDREEQSQYRVPIRVTDGMPGHARVTIYWITVQDVNDVPPVFDRSLGVYEVQLPESREVGKPTGIRLAVDDADLVNQFTFDIISGNERGKFRIDPTSRTLIVDAPLDYDDPVNDRNFTLRVRVSDGANAAAVTDVVVAVVNVNDLQPVFQRANYSFVVTENTDCSVPLGQVSARDPDLPPSVNQDIIYYLSPDEQTNFTIDTRSGHLSVKGCLDREAAPEGIVILYPRATDEGGEGHDAEPATVQVTILDINDNYPHLVRPPQSYAKVMENLEPHLVEPVVLELGDLDAAEHGCPCSLEFHAATPDAIRDKFTLTPLGRSRYRLSPATILDREQQKVYRLSFTARDRQGVGGTRSLTLEVGDENDSPMTDGTTTIRVYDYQGQFPALVVGAVHVTDRDDNDREDKTFQVEPSSGLEATAHFTVDLYTGDITMLRGTPAGTHTLTVTVHDSFRGEEAVGEATVSVVELTQEALTQSGSLRLANTTARDMLLEATPGDVRSSLYERLRQQIATTHQIFEDKVDVFLLRDAPGNLGVDVRYSCRGSPFCSAARLNALMLGRRQQVSAALGVDISVVDINACLYEATSPCGGHSCQHTLRPNLTTPLVVSGASASLVGLDVVDDYACSCGPLEPPPSVCYPGFCFNDGVCLVRNNTLTCQCPDSVNFGPRCELLTARFESSFAWYEPLTVCERSSLSFAFESHDKSGVLLYTGPTVPSPWPDYPRDFLYVILRNWVVETFLDLGTGTMNISIPIEANIFRTFHYVLIWGEEGLTAEVVNCGINATRHTSREPCRKSVPLAMLTSSSSSNNGPSHLLNAQGPLQVGGVASTVSFLQLADSYSWTLTPPSASPFSGCMMELRHNDHLYDFNATDYSKSPIQPCDAPRTSRVVLGRHSIIIILASLLSLLLLVVVILCLARRGRKSLSYPDLDRELVKETMGGTDLEGFGEKDVTHFDLKFLQVTPDGYLVGDENERALPDVAQDACLRDTTAPPAQLPDGVTIGEYIKENIVKVNQQHQELEDVRHYCVEGDEMSAASLSSLTSGSSRSDMIINCRTDWSQKFEKLVQIYRTGTEGDEDSEDESRSIPSQPSRPQAFPPRDSSEKKKNETRPSPPPPAPSSPTASVATNSRASYSNKPHPEAPHVPVLATKTTASESLTSALPITCHCSSVQASSHPSSETSNASLRSSSPKLNQQKVNPPSVCSTQVKQTPSSSLLHKQNLNAQTTAASKLKGNTGVTTINNLYTNPAQRSSAAIKPPHAPPDRPGEAAKEPVVNGHLKGNSSVRQCSAKPAPQLSSSSINRCDNQKAKAVKGVETWC
ncbi:neural-cadherin-like isoform X3 [Portunus trituberculatus]|uniref:neural-cadherin-like isoform X3 n=1 Tax=Portunus trituberculatus TaxID=210409 RepID=UPI001E1CB1E0|nr:neural-cadherin-like isoform X3 [Portunus trituberculatus]